MDGEPVEDSADLASKAVAWGGAVKRVGLTTSFEFTALGVVTEIRTQPFLGLGNCHAFAGGVVFDLVAGEAVD